MRCWVSREKYFYGDSIAFPRNVSSHTEIALFICYAYLLVRSIYAVSPNDDSGNFKITKRNMNTELGALNT